MSMILEALSRAEKERQAENNPHLDTARYITSSTIKEERFKKWVLMALAANFILIVVFAGAYFWNNYMNANTLEAAGVNEQSTEVMPEMFNQNDVAVNSIIQPTDQVVSKSTQAKTLLPQEQVTNQPYNDNNTTATSSLESEAHVKTPKPIVSKVKKAVASKPVNKVPPVQYSSKPLSQASSSEKPTVASIAKAVSREQQVTTSSNYTLHSNLPIAQRAELNKYEVNVHVYDDSPSSRFVLINMVKYKEGDSISGLNANISTIVPEGVVLNYAGQQVLIERNK